MARSEPAPIVISSLRGGLNDNDPPMVMEGDSCTIAENVEFFYSTMGERRLGCESITDLPTSITADSNIQAVTWAGRHLPDNDLSNAELWLLGQHLSAANNVLTRRTTTAWSTVTPVDAITSTSGYGHRLSAVSLHGKFFIAYKSGVDLLHVWDGSSLRRVLLPAPTAAPTAADTGAGTFSGVRYYRVRYVTMSGSSVIVRSEPSSVLTFTPGGAGSAARVTKPAAANQGETHWELEASTDNANFYRIARTIVGTTTYDDSVVYATGYANSGGTLSEDLTSYTRIPSGKFLTVDEDRLLIGGSWETPAYGSRIWWTPVYGSTGTGNDERLDMTVNPFIDLDGFEGGDLTGLSRAVNGYLYAFKRSHIYKIVRTGQRTSAYSAVPITKARGALFGSLVEAVDQTGSAAQYFLDPRVGPMRIGQYGLEWCGRDLRAFWTRVNVAATTPSHGIFYPAKNQVHFWVAVDGADHPNAKIIVQCNEMRSSTYVTIVEGARRGWSTVPVGDRIADAHCSIVFDDNVDSVGARSQNLVPFIGKEQWTVTGATIKDLLQICDVGTSDAYTAGDTDAYYYASVQTKPFLPTGLLQKHGAMAASLMASTVENPSNYVYVKGITDFGKETKQVAVNISMQDAESTFVSEIDNLSFSTIHAVQFAFGDLETNVVPSTSWRLHAFAAKIRAEETQ